jgi:hypothetical protein
MGRTRTWVDWAVLTLCMAAALGAVLFGARTLDVSSLTHADHSRSAVGALALIAGLALVNCGFLLGVALCKARSDLRLGRREGA